MLSFLKPEKRKNPKKSLNKQKKKERKKGGEDIHACGVEQNIKKDNELRIEGERKEK